ncbi:MAG: preprotein translocase subunit YajC [Coxiellaceae bacterium]|nr:MAG: preprotein translocase subunit YajC [Coxiellaceae bacterium]
MSLLNLLGIQDALAETAATVPATTTSTAAGTAHAAGTSSYLSVIWMVVLFFVVFYFLLMRPQSKRAKEHRKLLDGLTKGDEVVTNAGIMGKVVKISEDFIVLNIAENVDITLQKQAIVGVLPKGTIKSVE